MSKSFWSKRKEGILGLPSFPMDGFSSSPQKNMPWESPTPLLTCPPAPRSPHQSVRIFTNSRERIWQQNVNWAR